MVTKMNKLTLGILKIQTMRNQPVYQTGSLSWKSIITFVLVGGGIEKLEKRKFSNGKILMWTDNTKFVAICDLSISIGF